MITGVGARAIVAVKSFDRAKSRFVGVDPGWRRRLVWAMLLDTLEPLHAVVDRIVVVSAEPGLQGRLTAAGLPTIVVADGGAPPGRTDTTVVPEDGINAALRTGEQHPREVSGWLTMALTADLPSLRRREVADILDAATMQPRSFLRDHEGTGTTMVISRGALDPRFGPDSARRHHDSGATELTGGWPGARLDVDDRASLDAAAAVGLGRHTAALVDELR